MKKNKWKNLCLVFLMIILTACTAVEVIERHKISPYGLAEMYEKGSNSLDSPSSNVSQSYENAYALYLSANRMGDIRAPEKLKLSPH